MTHTGPMHESQGEFTPEAGTSLRTCLGQCGVRPTPHTCQSWDSSCGGYTDYKYTCTVCGGSHWVDGIDS